MDDLTKLSLDISYPKSSLTSISTQIPPSDSLESPVIQEVITTLNLRCHIEGGYFVETDRDTRRVPNPFPHRAGALTGGDDTTPYTSEPGADNSTRSASTSIYYLLTPARPVGFFHRNKARCIHTLHWGRGRYIIIHADEARPGEEARIETFVVGKNILAGERMQWVVEGGKYKCSMLLQNEEPDDAEGGKGLLISETVVPGFEYFDHDFLTLDRLEEMVEDVAKEELKYFTRQHGD